MLFRSLLFIEEPESHMHPQMQTAFATYLEKFLGKLSDVKIQTFLTSHSAHIANTMEFAKVRYAQKSSTGVIYKNLNTFAEANPDNVDFIRKYLTLTRCDLFFADKAIFVEGASERLLLPDMIGKCESSGIFGEDGRRYSCHCFCRHRTRFQNYSGTTGSSYYSENKSIDSLFSEIGRAHV